MELATLSELIRTDFDVIPGQFLGMFYGDNGSGKSKLALEVAADITPLDKVIIYLDTSKGYQTLNNHPELAAKLKGRLGILPYQGEDQLLTLVQAIELRKEWYGNIGCIILDEASSMAQHILDTVVAGRCLADPSKEKNFAARPDYAIAGNKWRYIIQALQRLPSTHIIQVAHYRTDEVLGIQKMSPAFQPQVGNDTRKELQFIGMTETQSFKENGKDVVVRTVQCHGTKQALAKTRIRLHGEEMPLYLNHEAVQLAIREYIKPVKTNNTIQELEGIEVD